MAEQTQMQHRLIRLPDVLKRVGLSRSSVYARVQAGTFPSPIKMGYSSRWVESEVQAWIDQQIEATRASA